MNHVVVTYVIYLIISASLTVWVARTLHKNGRLFLVDCFHGHEKLADSVNHGWRLDMEPTLQYLYYLSQVGLGLCPLSNDALFIQMKDSPEGKLHKRGLRVCLGTDDPLQFHNTATPLLEEYTVGGHFFEVRPCLCLCLCLSFFSVSLFCVCLSTYITTFFFSPQHINTRTHTVHGHRQE